MSVRDRLGPLYDFDHEQLVRNVRAKKAADGLSFPALSMVTAVAESVLKDYFAAKPARPDRKRSMISATTAFRLLMWLGDHDIRDYLLEER